MGRFNVVISPSELKDGPAMMLETVDIASALTVTEINLANSGTAQIFHEGRAVASIRKRAGDYASYWEVG